MHAGESPRSVAPSRPRSRLATSFVVEPSAFDLAAGDG